jgi:ADP-L-glycero-D-manno-heptose 6-epimerase
LGFIGSALIGELLRLGYGQLVAVDDFSHHQKLQNLTGKPDLIRVARSEFFPWLKKNADQVQFIFHMGARTKTNEFDLRVLQELNVQYTQDIWNICSEHSIPLIYASSAATYGNGDLGFNDDPTEIVKLCPLNPYGNSKHEVDLWILNQKQTPPFWAGFKFFNVFGPNEYHKSRMASVVFHAFHQIKDTGKMRLFKSEHSDYPHGEQRRDFVYIKDVLKVLIHFMESRKNSGIYNLGSGRAHTFKELAQGVFKSLQREECIEYVDMPDDIKNNYQYFTEARLERLKQAGYTLPFWVFEEAIKDYVQEFLVPHKYL